MAAAATRLRLAQRTLALSPCPAPAAASASSSSAAAIIRGSSSSSSSRRCTCSLGAALRSTRPPRLSHAGSAAAAVTTTLDGGSRVVSTGHSVTRSSSSAPSREGDDTFTAQRRAGVVRGVHTTARRWTPIQQQQQQWQGSRADTPANGEGSVMHTPAAKRWNPRSLVAHLDEFVVGQQRAKKVLAVAVYNHYARLRHSTPPPPPPATPSFSHPSPASTGSQTGSGASANTRERPQSRGGAGERTASSAQYSSGGVQAATASASASLLDGQPADAPPSSAKIRPRPRVGARGPPTPSSSTSASSSPARSAAEDGASASSSGSRASRASPSAQADEVPIAEKPTPSTLFDPSYVPPAPAASSAHSSATTLASPSKDQDTSRLDPPPSSRTRSQRNLGTDLGTDEPFVPKGDPDPTLYDHHSHVGGATPAAPAHASSRENAEAELLSDYVGQDELSRHTPPPQPQSRSSRSSSSSSSSQIPIGHLGSASGGADEVTYEKSNVLLLGPTGSGKTLLARTLARSLDVPFVGVEATGLTMAGYVGEDVESCVARLLAAADYDVARAERGIVFIDEVDKLARAGGGATSSHGGSPGSAAKDVAGEGVQQAFLKILEGTVVNVTADNAAARDAAKGGSSQASATATGGPSAPPPPPRKGQTFAVDTTGILFILSGAFVGLERTVLRRVATRPSIGFHATVAVEGARPPADDSRLKMPDGFFTQDNAQDTTALLDKVEPVDLVSYGFIPEFIGRVPIVASLAPLSEDDLVRVLTEPRNALMRQYTSLMRADGVELRLTPRALREVARAASQKGTGARGLRRAMEHVLLEPMYDAPESSIRYVLIDASVVRGEREAHYYSRGQHHLFQSDYDADCDPAPTAVVEAEAIESEPDSLDDMDTDEHQVERRRATA